MNQGTRIEWTTRRDARLRILWDTGMASREIGDALGASDKAIGARARKIGLPPREGQGIKRSNWPKKAKPSGVWPLLPVPKPGRPVTAEPASKRAVTLMDLPSFGACKFPVGDATGAAQLFCAAAVTSLYLRYCDHHCRVAYVAPSARPNTAFTAKSESAA